MKKPPAAILLDPEKCRGCGLCIEVCKRGVLEFREEADASGRRSVTVVHPEKCVLCGLCVAVCPLHVISLKK